MNAFAPQKAEEYKMSGSIWASESARAWRAERRNMQPFRNADDPMRGQPVPPEPRERRRRRRTPQPSQITVCDPRRIHRVSRDDPSSFDLGKITHHENLALIWRQLRESGGHAPGVDGMTFDVSPSQFFEVLRNVAQAVRNRLYVPAPTRRVQIRKPSGGYRILEIPTIIDRVVGAAMTEALRVVLMNRLPRHYGNSASCHAILARIKINTEDRGWNWIAVDDIQNFFPSIPRELAMDCFMREADHWGISPLLLTQSGIPWLVRQIIYGHEGETRTIGLSQGSTFSPLVASIVLQDVLDRAIDHQIGNRMVMHRYADNIHVQGPDRSEVRSVMDDIQPTLSQHGMTLKGAAAQPIDVRRPSGQTILGAIPSWKNDRLLFNIPDTTWDRLEEKIYEAPTGTGADSAQPVIKGFISAFRPTFRVKADNAVDRIHSLMKKGGKYRIRKDTIREWIAAARVKWETEVNNIRNPTPLPQDEYESEPPGPDTGPWDGTAPWRDL